jgi:lauroyl/myristoyl acyltransferase
MVIDLGPEVVHGDGPDGLQAMTQQTADHFATTIRRQPQDWPMLQRFFARPELAS